MKKILSLLALSMISIISAWADDAVEYTVTFKNNAKWEAVYAYVYSGEGDDLVEITGEFPGEEVEADFWAQLTGEYEYSFVSTVVPEYIIFSNGLDGDELEKTEAFEFEDEGEYQNETTLESVKVSSIDALNYIENPSLIELTLNNAVVTYRWIDEETYESGKFVIEDETGGVLINDVYLASSFYEGMVYNGTIHLLAEDKSGWGVIELGFAGYDYAMELFNLDAEETEVTPLEVNDQTLDDYMYAYNWKLAKFTDATVHVEHGTWGDDYLIELGVMGNSYTLFDVLGILPEDPELNDGDKVEVVGYLFDYNLLEEETYFQPLTITVAGDNVDPIELAAITPAPGLYDALPTEWVLTYGGKKLAVNEDAEVVLTNGEVEYPLYIFLDEEDDTQAIIAFDGKAITTPGKWTVEIPGNTITVAGKTIADPQSFKYTVKNPVEYEIDPAPGTVASLQQFIISFNNYMIELNDEEANAFLFNLETEEEVPALSVDVIAGGTALWILLEKEVTTAGQWQLVVMDASVKDLTNDKFVPELAFDYIIDPTIVGISSVKAAAQEGQVYNLQGTRVSNPQKGLYIVNGKKVLVK